MLWCRSCLAWLWLGLAAAAAQTLSPREAARLDREGRCDESEPYYREALAVRSPSPALLNNAGNHYLICGQPEKARPLFGRLVRANPAHQNANLQLARLAVQEKRGREALAYLERVQTQEVAVGLLRSEALHWAGRQQEALAKLNSIEEGAGGDAGTRFAAGLVFARLGLYDRAEKAFHEVLVRRPGDFQALLHLGRAAARAGRLERARGALETAVKLRPGDAEALMELGLLHAATKDYSRAVYLLAQARQKAPGRPDIVLALARASEDAGYFGDSALAYDEYVRLQPADETARRDRARILGLTGDREAEGLKEMAAYVATRPKDPVGHYNLAQFSWRKNPDQSLAQLATALQLDPKFTPAHVSRAWLLHRLGRSEEAAAHLKQALAIAPDNLRALDQLGLVYLALERPADAEPVLRRALDLAPEDPDVLVHLGRALMALSREDEAQRFLEKHQQARPRRSREARREPGMIELATLPEPERRSREIERLGRLSRARPDDPVLQLHLAELQLADGRIAEAEAQFRQLLVGSADARMLERAGRALVAAERYDLGRQLLERAVRESPGARLDLSVALLHTEGPAAALAVLEEGLKSGRTGDLLLMKARILDAAGRRAEAGELLTEGLRRETVRPEVAQPAALLLARDGRQQEALDLLARSLRSAPDHGGLLLTQAIVLALAKEFTAAGKRLQEIESRWPEWHRPYLVHGFLLERGERKQEAIRMFKTAMALGSAEPAAACALARLSHGREPDDHCVCRAALSQWLFGCNTMVP